MEAGRDALDQASGFVERQRQDLTRRKERVATAFEAGREAFREDKPHS
jgi:hypothetical protein